MNMGHTEDHEVLPGQHSAACGHEAADLRRNEQALRLEGAESYQHWPRAIRVARVQILLDP
jgi:hypothetical protein